jgi:hypothetical protein
VTTVQAAATRHRHKPAEEVSPPGPADPTTDFAVAPASDDLSGSDLPFTGFDVAALAMVGALVLAGGALLRRVAVRRGAA